MCYRLFYARAESSGILLWRILRNKAMNMKKIILLTLILGLLSCSASRKVSSSIKTEITDKTEANVTQKRDKDSSGRTESHMTEDSSEAKDTEVVIEKFDTDKPTDPATGTPPLKERTTIRERQQTQQQTQATTKTGTHVHESDSIADLSKYNIELQSQVSDIVKTKRAVPWWVWVIGGGCILIVGWMVKRRLKLL